MKVKFDLRQVEPRWLSRYVIDTVGDWGGQNCGDKITSNSIFDWK